MSRDLNTAPSCGLTGSVNFMIFVSVKLLLENVILHLEFHGFSTDCFSDTTLSGEIGTKKKVKRLLSFQRYFHASRLLRGIVPQASLYLLDEDYLGQARVRQVSSSPFIFIIFQTASVLFQPSGKQMYGWSFLNVPRYLPVSQRTDCPFLFYGYSFNGLVSKQQVNV